MIGSKHIRINANRCVICSAGTLNTPCILLKSGFKNRHIGQHLHLHPVTCAVGLIPEEKTKSTASIGEKDAESVGDRKSDELNGFVLGWNKAPMTVVCNEFASGPANDGYGAKIECPSVHTGLMGAGLNWTDPMRFKETLAVAKNAVTLIVLQRDRSEGRVYPDKNGRPRVSYELEERDKNSMIHSLCGGNGNTC